MKAKPNTNKMKLEYFRLLEQIFGRPKYVSLLIFKDNKLLVHKRADGKIAMNSGNMEYEDLSSFHCILREMQEEANIVLCAEDIQKITRISKSVYLLIDPQNLEVGCPLPEFSHELLEWKAQSEDKDDICCNDYYRYVDISCINRQNPDIWKYLYKTMITYNNYMRYSVCEASKRHSKRRAFC
jgi:hypothetical protein